jgi:excisionase family DNA binding protein
MTSATRADLEERVRSMTPVSAPPRDRATLRQLREALKGSDAPKKKGRVRRCELVGPEGQRIPLPDAAFYVLERVVEVLERGDAITVVPVGKELTTQQAADLLNVSRQYLVRVLDGGRIPFSKTGTHRRVKVEDVLAFKRRRDEERRGALDELTALSEELGGYEELE